MNLKLLCFNLLLFWHILPVLPKMEEWEIPTKLRDGLNTVDYYNIFDQCQPIPDYPTAYIHQLALKITKNAYCDGKGFLLYYFGQTDKTNTNQGLIPSLDFRMKNVNNNVTKKCKTKQEECLQDATCQEWAKDAHDGEDWKMPQLHGMQLTVDHQNVTIQLSTTTSVFVVPRNKFDEVLTIKLASSKHGGISFLSSNIGPLREPGNPNDHQELVEKRGRIHVPEDWKLWKDYDNRRPSGMPLRKRVGIWSLGVDILPMETAEQIKLMVERSKCCKIDAWFMLPTSQPPVMESLTIEHIGLVNPYQRIGKGMNITLEGRFMKTENLKEIQFVLENHFQDKYDSLGEKFIAARIRIKFSDDDDSSTVTFQQKSTSSKNWDKPEDLPGRYFFRGGHFNIDVYFHEEGLIIALNCHDEALSEFKYIESMIYEDLYMLKITDEHGELARGLAELHRYKPSNVESRRSWKMVVEKGSGVYFTGKMPKDGKSFMICLRGIGKVMDQGNDDGPKLYLCLQVDIGQMKYIMRSDFFPKHAESFEKRQEIGIHAGNAYQLYIQFPTGGDKLRICMAPEGTGEEKWELVKEFDLDIGLSVEKRIIDFVQLLGQFEKDGGYLPPYVPPALPYSEKFEIEVLFTHAYQIVGYILPRADATFGIKMLRDTEPNILILGLDFEFVENAISRGSLVVDEGGNHPLAIGKKFVLKIHIHEEKTASGKRNLNCDLIFNNGVANKTFTQDNLFQIREISMDHDVLVLEKGFIQIQN